ncbi:MAG: hypothetical protein OXE53_11080 [Deltaproteobacteria bacterium]|nr:hypothetical protein [Deltaproteobacteria bacterium]
MAHRDPTSPFGTSLIDLLVGALAIVALLWVLHARNSGEIGSGDHERTSGFVQVEQYGLPHIKNIRLVVDGVTECAFDIEFRRYRRGEPTLSNSTPCTMLSPDPRPIVSGAASGTGQRTDRATVTLARIHGKSYDPPLVISMRAVYPDGEYRAGVQITVQDLGEQAVIADVGIEPCCSMSEPHYLRVLTMSGSGRTDQTMFWHEVGLLQHTLACNRGNPVDSRLCTRRQTDPTDHPDWVKNFKQQIAAGTLQTSRHLFQLTRPSGGSFYSIANARSAVSDCTAARRGLDSRLRVRFEPDGDIHLSPQKAITRATATGAPWAAEYTKFVQAYDRLLTDYATTP